MPSKKLESEQEQQQTNVKDRAQSLRSKIRNSYKIDLSFTSSESESAESPFFIAPLMPSGAAKLHCT